jgi:hypothetical protein
MYRHRLTINMSNEYNLLQAECFLHSFYLMNVSRYTLLRRDIISPKRKFKVYLSGIRLHVKVAFISYTPISRFRFLLTIFTDTMHIALKHISTQRYRHTEYMLIYLHKMYQYLGNIKNWKINILQCFKVL